MARTSLSPEPDLLVPKIGPPSQLNAPFSIFEVLQRYKPRGNPGILSLIPAPAEKYQFRLFQESLFKSSITAVQRTIHFQLMGN